MKPGDSVADIGGGDGGFLRETLKEAAITVVEPSAAMISTAATADDESTVTFENRSAEDWARGEGLFDRVLLKEVLHHIEEPVTFFTDVRQRRLRPSGRVLIATRPREDTDYPFFPAAVKVWRENQPSLDAILADLKAADFTAEAETHVFPVEIALETWLGMIRQRFWSTFSNFTDDEIEAGCLEIAQKFKPDILKFEERFILINATAN